MSAFGMAGRRKTPTVGHGIHRLPPASRAGNLSGLATCDAERSSTRTGFAGIANLPAALYFALLRLGRAFSSVRKCGAQSGAARDGFQTPPNDAPELSSTAIWSPSRA